MSARLLSMLRATLLVLAFLALVCLTTADTSADRSGDGARTITAAASYHAVSVAGPAPVSGHARSAGDRAVSRAVQLRVAATGGDPAVVPPGPWSVLLVLFLGCAAVAAAAVAGPAVRSRSARGPPVGPAPLLA